MPQEILRRLTWRQIVVLYEYGWEAERIRAAKWEIGREAEHPSQPLLPSDEPDVATIERLFGDKIVRKHE